MRLWSSCSSSLLSLSCPISFYVILGLRLLSLVNSPSSSIVSGLSILFYCLWPILSKGLLHLLSLVRLRLLLSLSMLNHLLSLGLLCYLLLFSFVYGSIILLSLTSSRPPPLHSLVRIPTAFVSSYLCSFSRPLLPSSPFAVTALLTHPILGSFLCTISGSAFLSSSTACVLAPLTSAVPCS